VTETSGIDAQGYGMGAAVGDVDNDGWPDLYVTNFRDNQLWRNRGDGTFEDITEKAGVGDRRWSVPAVFWDYDRDGWLDLYVGNYVDFSVATHKRCTTELGTPNYCGPLAFEPQEDVLFHNRGDGTFEDVTGRAGLRGSEGGALGAMPADVDGNGWLDLYVANDGTPNALWMNQGDGTFRNEALLAGAAVNRDGQPEASMGLDAADVDGDGDEDFFMTHLRLETNTLYLNAGDGTFEDASVPSGLGASSLEATGFGTVFLDVDNDGILDLLVVNGAVKIIEELALAGDPFPLHEKNRLYRGLGGGRFEDVTALAGGAFLRSEVSRGAVVGDLDNDGDGDLLLTQNAGPARLLLNRQDESGEAHGWVGLRLLDGHGREALGAWVRLEVEGSSPAWRRARTAGSYASSNDSRLLFGLGKTEASAADVLVLWPDDRGPRQERFTAVATGRYTTLRRGEGKAVARP
jgi:enediyne biosynthesis protein E4